LYPFLLKIFVEIDIIYLILLNICAILISKKQLTGDAMAYKKIENYISFADLAINKNADKNRSLQFLRKIDNSIDWEPIEELLIKFYKIGKAKEGERAYSPLLLFKCFLLQKWFQIKSDPELESQINDRISFKSFLKLRW
jgi:IS5 family transposase